MCCRPRSDRWTAEPAAEPASAPADARPAGRPLLLREVVSGGVGGVARRLLLAKLGEGIVPDSDEPLDLNDTYRLLPGRAPKDGVPESRYAPPLRYAEGEEEHPGRAGPEGGRGWWVVSALLAESTLQLIAEGVPYLRKILKNSFVPRARETK